MHGNDIYEDVFQYSVDRKLSIKECKNECKKADKAFKQFRTISETKKISKMLKLLGEEMNSGKLLNSCKSQCNILPEFLEDMEMKESQQGKNKKRNNFEFEKREEPCIDISKGKINLIESNYEYQCPMYQQDPSSAKTALAEANGCGPKIVGDIGVGSFYKGLFLPACNSHDVCYDCQKGKTFCDNQFKNNMYNMCDIKYDSTTEKRKNNSCKSAADIFYSAVNLYGQSSYNRSDKDFDASTSCAFCGTSVVKDILVYSPFYRKK